MTKIDIKEWFRPRRALKELKLKLEASENLREGLEDLCAEYNERAFNKMFEYDELQKRYDNVVEAHVDKVHLMTKEINKLQVEIELVKQMKAFRTGLGSIT